MRDIHFTDVQQASAEVFQTGTHLILLYANKKPPHLALLSNGRYFSVSVKGVQIENASLIQQLIDKKKIPTLFIELELEMNESILNSIFDKSTLNQATCIRPIRETLSHQSGKEEYLRAGTIFELYEILENQSAIGMIRQKYLLTDGEVEFTLPFYTREEVEAYIRGLK